MVDPCQLVPQMATPLGRIRPSIIVSPSEYHALKTFASSGRPSMLLGTQSQNLIPLPTPGTIAAGKMGQLWQTMGQRKNGDYFPIEISISKIELDSRQIAIVRDITSRQQTEAKLQARAGELVQLNLKLSRINVTLEQRNQELDKFAYVTSHDLKAPLRAIANLAHWIGEDLGGELPPENQHHLRLLRGRVDRMEALLDGLLEYSRIGRQNIPIELVNVHQLVIDIIKFLDPPSTFTIKIAPDLPTLTTRQLLLKQVLIGLIDNAIEHHPDQYGTVEITSTDLGDRYEFAVTDDGQGIEVYGSTGTSGTSLGSAASATSGSDIFVYVLGVFESV